MIKIELQSITLLNFKGIRDLTVEFAETTTISGRNATGKTTIMDAFHWLLFGKDSQDRKAFEIKTLDANGVAIPKLPHEVSATLVVDGEKISLRRCYNEKWVKRRGIATEEFTGHEEERYYNDVPCSVKEWTEKINGICSEQVFKFVTNPLYFTNQNKDVQRSMLFRMAGEISDGEIADGNADFTQLLAALTGKTLEEYRKEIALDGERKSDKIVGYFCYFELLNGFSKTLYMSVEDMAKYAKKYSPTVKFSKDITAEKLADLANKEAANGAIGWAGSFNDMALKTVIRRLLSRYGYLSVEMQDALSKDTEDAQTDRDNLINANANAETIDVDAVEYETIGTETGEIAQQERK